MADGNRESRRKDGGAWRLLGDLKGLLFSVTQDLLSIISWMTVAKGYLYRTSSFLKFIIGALFSERRAFFNEETSELLNTLGHRQS